METTSLGQPRYRLLGSVRAAALLLTCSVLALALFDAAPALAGGGAGGTVGNCNQGAGAGGTGFAGGSGGNGALNVFGCGGAGGGGGAAGGGQGGTGGTASNNAGANNGAGAGGAAGTAGGDGANGVDGFNANLGFTVSTPGAGGGGGGGGANGNGAGAASLSNAGNVTGGNGGAGGAGGSVTGLGGFPGAGGGGGAGGYGAIVTGTGVSTNSGTITGGNGGAGGAGGTGGSGNANAGGGGDGGIGVFFNASGASLTNSGTITGGNGGASTGTAGVGGVGVVGSGLTITNSGTISGGSANAGTGARANAITFTGGTNSLTITSTSTINGKVVAFSNADTFGLGGSTNSTFNVNQLGANGSGAQYQGFGILQKSGSGTWTLTGTPGGNLAYQIQAGILSLGSAGALGSTGAITFSGGTLQFSASNTTDYSARFATTANQAFNIDTNGQNVTMASAIASTGGTLTKSGTGTLTLSGNNTYSGATNVNGGTLQVDGVITTSAITVNNGGTLSGVGKLGDPTINAGGTLAPGNANTPLGTMTIAGQPLVFQQGSYFAVNIAPNGNSQVVLTTGAVATINGGTVQATFQPGSYITKQYTLLSGGTVTGTFASLANTNLPAGFTSSLAYTPTSVLLDLKAVLSASGLNANEAAIANALNAYFNGGAPLSAAFISLFGLTGSQFAAALDQLSPQLYAQAVRDALAASAQFSNDLMSCRVPGSDTGAVIREGQCVWAKGRERTTGVNSTATDLGIRDRASSFAAGAQLALGGGWTFGGAVGYDQTSLNGATTVGTSDRVNSGLALKYTSGPLQLIGTLSGAWSTLNSNRVVTTTGLAGTQSGKSDVDTYATHMRAAYLIDLGGWYAKPMVDVSATRVDFSGLSETGTAAALRVMGGRDWVIATSPALEFGANIMLSKTTSLRPFVRTGVTWSDAGSLSVDAQFLAAPQTFTTTTHLDRVTADVATGFDLVGAGGAALRLEYDGHFGGTTTSTSFMAKGSLPF